MPVGYSLTIPYSQLSWTASNYPLRLISLKSLIYSPSIKSNFFIFINIIYSFFLKAYLFTIINLISLSFLPHTGYSRRKHREPCRRVISFHLSLRVDRIYEHRIVWDNKLIDRNSEPYGQLSYESVRAVGNIHIPPHPSS